MNQQTWEQFLLSSPERSFLQSWVWGEFQEKYGYKIFRYSYEDAEQVLAIALLLRYDLSYESYYWYSPRGPVFAPGVTPEKKLVIYEDIKNKLREFHAGGFPTVFWRADPFEGCPMGEPEFKHIQPRETLLLNISASEDDLLASMKQKTRYNIRLAEKKGVAVTAETSPEAVEIFYALAQQTAKRDKFHFHVKKYYQNLLEVLGPAGMAEILIARVEGKSIAANIVYYYGGIATYAHGASANEGREAMPTYLLQWEAIKRAKARGMGYYDFYGIGEQWAGVTRFKEGFTPEGSPYRVYRKYPEGRDIALRPLQYKLIQFLKSLGL